MSEMDTWTDEQLTEAAMKAFTLGQMHGARGKKRLTSQGVTMALELPGDRRVIHREAMGRVYGAGFALGALKRKLPK